VDRLTRKELKTDKFAVEVGQTVDFLERHRREVTLAGAALVVVILAAVGFYYYSARQHDARQLALYDALRTYEGTVGPENAFSVSFPTQEAKRAAVIEEFQGILDAYPGSDEALIAHLYLGVTAAGEQRPEDAEGHLRQVADSKNEELASQAALALATVYAELGRLQEGEQLLRDLIDNPTHIVSSEQATIALADLLIKTRPEEARQLLEPLRGERSAVSRAALSMLGQLDTGPNQ